MKTFKPIYIHRKFAYNKVYKIKKYDSFLFTLLFFISKESIKEYNTTSNKFDIVLHKKTFSIFFNEQVCNIVVFDYNNRDSKVFKIDMKEVNRLNSLKKYLCCI